MTAQEILALLDRAIAGAAPGEKPGLVVALSARLAALGAGLAPADAGAEATTTPETFNLKPEDAATIAHVNVGQIYAWSKGQRWASRPSKRCIRISEAGFRRWLAAKAR